MLQAIINQITLELNSESQSQERFLGSYYTGRQDVKNVVCDIDYAEFRVVVSHSN